MDVLRPSLQVLDGAVWEHAVTEVEDMAGAAPGGLDHPTRAVFNEGPWPQQQGGIQVALDAAVVPDHAPGLAQVDPPIHPNHVAPGLTHQWKDAGGSRPEMDRRRPSALQAGE